jgi:hypothetical protein
VSTWAAAVRRRGGGRRCLLGGSLRPLWRCVGGGAVVVGGRGISAGTLLPEPAHAAVGRRLVNVGRSQAFAGGEERRSLHLALRWGRRALAPAEPGTNSTLTSTRVDGGMATALRAAAARVASGLAASAPDLRALVTRAGGVAAGGAAQLGGSSIEQPGRSFSSGRALSPAGGPASTSGGPPGGDASSYASGPGFETYPVGAGRGWPGRPGQARGCKWAVERVAAKGPKGVAQQAPTASVQADRLAASEVRMDSQVRRSELTWGSRACRRASARARHIFPPHQLISDRT